jgi:hypothetical protein
MTKKVTRVAAIGGATQLRPSPFVGIFVGINAITKY